MGLVKGQKKGDRQQINNAKKLENGTLKRKDAKFWHDAFGHRKWRK